MEIELIMKNQNSRLQLFISVPAKTEKGEKPTGAMASMLIISMAENHSVKLSLNNDFDNFHFDQGTCVSVEKDVP